MSVIYFLIGVGVLVAGGFLFAFIWAVKSGQYDDDYTPSVRMLFDNFKSESQETETQISDQLPNEKNDVKMENSNINKS
jgi:cbb3-type cytochrome oxidase maturation protein